MLPEVLNPLPLFSSSLLFLSSLPLFFLVCSAFHLVSLCSLRSPISPLFLLPFISLSLSLSLCLFPLDGGMLRGVAFTSSCSDCVGYWIDHIYDRAVMGLPTGAILALASRRYSEVHSKHTHTHTHTLSLSLLLSLPSIHLSIYLSISSAYLPI